MSGWAAFQIATTLFRSGTHDQKVSVTFCPEEDDDDDAEEDADVEEDALEAVDVADDELPEEEQPAPASVAIAAVAAIAVTRTRRVPRRGERITARRPPSMSFMAPPKDERR
jgi:hypothetical protein